MWAIPDHAAHPSPNLPAKATPPTAPGILLVSDIVTGSLRWTDFRKFREVRG
jgi:hypothetical protein